MNKNKDDKDMRQNNDKVIHKKEYQNKKEANQW